jgi:flagellin-like protein
MGFYSTKSLLIQGEKMRKIMDNKAVSPVVGTILLIAITVALAAIVATLVSGLGGRGAPPSVMLTVTAKDTGTGVTTLTIAHNGGDDLNTNDLKIQVTDNLDHVYDITSTMTPTGTLSVGGSLTATWTPSPLETTSGTVITVYVIHNPSKQKLFSSSAITVQSP